MMSSTTDKFEQIKLEAGRLLEAGSPTTAAVLQIVQHLTPSDADRLARGEDLAPDTVSRISTTTDLKARVVAVVANRTVRADLSDYAQEYQALLDHYREVGSPDKEVEAFFGDLKSGRLYFLLHGPIPCV